MRRFFLVSVLLLSLLVVSGFAPLQQSNTISVLNRSGQPTAQITDGDGIQIKVSLSQPASQQETITFQLGEIIVGSCIVPGGSITCTTDLFPSLGWHWGIDGIPQDT